MTDKTLTAALISGGKMAMKVTAIGGVGLLLYILITNQKVVYLPQALIGITIVSVFMGGIKGGMSAGTQGWLHGFMVALMYIIISTIIRFFLFPESNFDQVSLILACPILAVGSIGGVAGINARFLRRKKRFVAKIY